MRLLDAQAPMSSMSSHTHFDGMRNIRAMEVVPKSLANGEHNARPLECSKKDVLVFDRLNRLLSNVMGVIGGVVSLVYGEGNPLIHLEENVL